MSDSDSEDFMGYRSDVYLVMYKEDYENIKKLPIFKYATKIRDFTCPENSDKYTFIIWDNIKWYEDSDDEVGELMDYLKNNLDYRYDYLRFGEDYEDVSEENYLNILDYIRTTTVYLGDISIDKLP